MSGFAAWPFLRIAHRGAAGLEPENTLLGLETALRFGVEMVEIDARPCADGTLLVVHDDDLERVAGQSIRVSEHTPAELRALDIGKGERIPLLEEALALLRGRALVNIDQKADNQAEALLGAIDRAGSREETMLSGCARRTYAAMRELAPALPLAWSVDAEWRDAPRIALARTTEPGARALAGSLIAAARTARCDGLALDWHLASTRVVARLRRAGIHVLTWTVDDAATMRALKAMGVNGVTSNRPDLLANLI